MNSFKFGKSMQVLGSIALLLFLISQISAFPFTGIDRTGYLSGEEYDQSGLREVLEELERQGGLTGQIVQRGSNYANSFPNHKMMRKSQRSNNLRLRFGKRSSSSLMKNRFLDELKNSGTGGGEVGYFNYQPLANVDFNENEQKPFVAANKSEV